MPKAKEASRVRCDRCRQVLVGGFEVSNGGSGGTCGFYKRRGWKKYMDDDEGIICDACMQSDERYLTDYPHMRKVPNAAA